MLQQASDSSVPISFRNKALLTTLLVSACALAQQSSQLSKEDARLNQLYAQRLHQLRRDPAALLALRVQERDWIKQRDGQCGKDVACLTGLTKTRADFLANQVAPQGSAAEHEPPIPQEIWGTWTIRKHLPTPGVTCWDEKQAQTLVGTEIEYRGGDFAWKDKTMRNLGSKTTVVEEKQFAQDHMASGGSVTFRDLGIVAAAVKQIEIQHPDVTAFDKSLDCCAAVPGETVLLKDKNTIIFDECGVFYQAVRKAGSKK